MPSFCIAQISLSNFASFYVLLQMFSNQKIELLLEDFGSVKVKTENPFWEVTKIGWIQELFLEWFVVGKCFSYCISWFEVLPMKVYVWMMEPCKENLDLFLMVKFVW